MVTHDFYLCLYDLAYERCNTVEGLAATLDLMARFPQLTPENLFLLTEQMPEATAVCGREAWEGHYHRTVRPGAEPIVLMRPALVDIEEIQEQGLLYEHAHVYDVSQTENAPEAVDPEEIPRLSAQDIITAFHKLTSCLVEKIPAAEALVRYDAKRNVLQVATDNETLIVREMLRAYSKYITRARGFYEDDLFCSLIGECAAYLMMRYHGVENPKAPSLYAEWNKGGHRKGHEFLHLLNQIYWTAQVVNREFCLAQHKPFIVSFHETEIIDQVFTNSDKQFLIERLGGIGDLTPHPSLISAAWCLKDSITRILTDVDVSRICRDREENRVLSQMFYSILPETILKR